MSPFVTPSRLRRDLLLLCLLTLLVGASLAASNTGSNPPALTNSELLGARELCYRIASLDRSVSYAESRRVGECAYLTAAELRHNYRVVGPPLFHNFLVNTGIRKRGLCFQWAEDLLVHLDRLKLTTLELHWGEARAGSLREHNCIVVTAKNQPFTTGIILDCWRHSGHLYWAPVSGDHYPWIEDSAYARIARGRLEPAARGQSISKQRVAKTTAPTLSQL